MVTIQESHHSKDNKVRVTFTMPPIDGCDCLYLIGRFYPWNESVYRMQRGEDGTWSLTLELEADRKFQYRFRTCDGTWLDDPSAPHSFSPERSPGSRSAATLLN